MSMDLKRRFSEYCEKEDLIPRESTVIVALSGGADSVCLLKIMSDISSKYGINPYAVHVHHGIRGEEADRDADFAKSFAKSLGVPIEVRYIDAPAYAKENGLTLEEAARILRYAELEEVRRSVNAERIALAHHRDDQTETVLMNFFRGSGASGLVGMKPLSGRLIRPMLRFTKKEILEYLQEHNVKYVEDSTNSSNEHTRNRIRNELIPLMDELYPDASGHVAVTADDVRKWQSYIGEELDEYLKGITASPKEQTDSAAGETDEINLPDEFDFQTCDIPADAYIQAPEVIRAEWIRRVVEAKIPARKDVNRYHYRMMAALLEDNITGRRIDLPGGYTAERTYNGLLIQKSEVERQLDNSGLNEKLIIPGETKISINNEKWYFESAFIERDIFNKKKNEFFAEKDYTKCLDYGKIKSGLCVRYPREGDYIVINDKGDRKKLSRYFIDSKIPRSERATQIVIADGSHIVWTGDRLSKAYEVTSDTERILKVTGRIQYERDDCQED